VISLIRTAVDRGVAFFEQTLDRMIPGTRTLHRLAENIGAADVRSYCRVHSTFPESEWRSLANLRATSRVCISRGSRCDLPD
jgi:hypothetical protein